LLDVGAEFEVELLDSFEFWTELDPDLPGLADAAVQAAEAMVPMVAVGATPGAYWTQMGGREYLRWSAGIEEETLLDALARLQARREAGIGGGGANTGGNTGEGRYAGAFRTLGLVIPVWNLPPGTTAQDLEAPLAEFATKLKEAAATQTPLTPPERRARAGLVARSITLR
jgi:hypothetical protein